MKTGVFTGKTGRFVAAGAALAVLGGGARAAGPVAPALPAPVAAPSLDFDKTFSDRGEPKSLSFIAAYTARGAGHRLEAWRSGDTLLRRRTDGRVDLFVARRPREAEFRMVVLDREKRIATRIDRRNLYRIGSFTDWFDLAHGLKHPLGAYQLAATSAPAGAAVPPGPCAWYQLDTGPQRSTLCWSRRYRLPLAIYTDGSTEPVWRVKSVSTAPVPTRVFAIDDAGYVENDANRDISND